MDAILRSSLGGVGQGAMYAMLALGIVLVYRGSGILNFGHGAMAMFSAYLFRWAVDERGLSMPLGLAVVAVFATVTAAVLYFVVMRSLRTAPQLARVVASLGVLLAFQGGAFVLFGDGFVRPADVLPDDNRAFAGTVELFDAPVTKKSLWLLAIAAFVALVLWLVYRYTRFGMVTQAAAENMKGAVLLGYSADRVAFLNWWLGSLLAAAAGILISPLTGLGILNLTLLIIPAMAAALVGRFSSFAITLIAGVAIGMARGYLTYRVSSDANDFLEPGLTDSVPFFVITVAMFVTGALIPQRGELTVGRPPKAPRPEGGFLPVRGTVALGAVAVLVLVLDKAWVLAITNTTLFALVGLSVVVVTGFTGQVSLAQMSLAGVAAFFTSKIADGLGMPMELALPLAAMTAVPIGVIIGLPALRVRGINLAIMTLGAGLAVENLILKSPKLVGNYSGTPVPTPRLAGIDFDSNAHPERFALMCLGVFAIVALAVRNLRRSRSGRRMLALRANERAAAAVGVDLTWQKLSAFMLSAFIAGLAGALLAYQAGTVNFVRFTVFASIFLVATVYVGGVGSIAGAVVAGLIASGGVGHEVFYPLLGDWFDRLRDVLSGLLVLQAVRMHPDGLAIAMRDHAARAVARLRRRPGPQLAEVPTAGA